MRYYLKNSVVIRNFPPLGNTDAIYYYVIYDNEGFPWYDNKEYKTLSGVNKGALKIARGKKIIMEVLK